MNDDFDSDDRFDDDLDMEALLEDAVAGDPEAQYLYGRELWLDADTIVDFAAAYAWMLRAARKGWGEAWWKLAVCADDGDGCDAPDRELAVRLAAIGWRRTKAAHCCTVAGDALTALGRHEQAAGWYRTGADAGDQDAMCSLGYCYRHGRGVPRDDREMIRWYARAARAGSSSAMYNLAICRRHGEGVRRSERAAFLWDRRAAAHGHELSAVRVASAHIDGAVAAHNPELGRAELERLAVEESNAAAARELGDRLLDGDGLPHDVADGIRWLEWAAEMGDDDAMTDLGVAYFNGALVERDVERGVAYYRHAVELGNPVATRNLGLCHRDGVGVPQDHAEAIRLWETAAEFGDGDAAERAARHLLAAGGAPAARRAVALLRSAVEDEFPAALRLLADCLEQGIGCSPDATEAARLHALAHEIDVESDAGFDAGTNTGP